MAASCIPFYIPAILPQDIPLATLSSISIHDSFMRGWVQYFE